MFKKITNRILFGYSIPLAFLLILGSLVFVSTRKALHLESEISNSEKILKTVDNLAYSTSLVLSSVRGYVLFPNNLEYKEQYEAAAAVIDEDSQTMGYLKEISNPEDNESKNTESHLNAIRQPLQTLIAESENLKQMSENIIRFVDANSVVSAKRDVQALKMDIINVQRDKILEEIDKKLQNDLEEFDRVERFLLLLVEVGTVVAILLTIAFGLWITWQLKQQMTRTIGASENLGIQVTSSATQIAASGKQLEATVAEQVASTNEVNATSKEIAATSRELVQTMDRVAQLSHSTAEVTANSQLDLVKMKDAMHQLAQATISIASKLGVMNEKANNINSVVTTITKVADRTNLLSLNAAIEAEKAGEYGAGFAVVAREIRRLADQTAVATLEIEQMVKEMQTSVSNGVMEMDKFNKEVSQYVEEVGQISEQISHAIEDVQSLTPQFAQVSQTMEEQSQGAQQIREAMEQLSEASQQTADAIRDTNTALDRLDDAARGLQLEISDFKAIV
ncbi:MAG: methyl-accepting chemotaxis protein [Cyanobacteria bacterium SID2]|nr:methyl-accepting chemotaxis protein [Cyanobacteria bacterium SID2]